MLNFIKTFRADEDGAVTVDWVVLTAAIVGLGVAAIQSVSGGINKLGTQVATDLESGGSYLNKHSAGGSTTTTTTNTTTTN